MTIYHTTDLTSDIYKDALAIRMEVFVNEQQVPESLEIEGEEDAIHFVLYDDNSVPLGTVRLVSKDKDTMKIQRMAILKSARAKGAGKKLMNYAEYIAKSKGATTLVLGGQLHALPFYESLGYSISSDLYLDAGIEHKDMIKHL